MAKRTKRPWPTKDAMAQIYDKHLWGGKTFDFYSGTGSHDPNIITPYLKAVSSFLKSFNHLPTICDLGCGDFNIGKHLIPYSKKYIAVDIVESLITRNKSLFKEKHLEFLCLDLAKDSLPLADCAILRQVLQHISNAEILSIIPKLYHYQYIILTEHIPSTNFTPNKDIISGQGIRIKQNSGVNLLAPPFNLKVKEKQTLTEYCLENAKGRIVTQLYKMF